MREARNSWARKRFKGKSSLKIVPLFLLGFYNLQWRCKQIYLKQIRWTKFICNTHTLKFPKTSLKKVRSISEMLLERLLSSQDRWNPKIRNPNQNQIYWKISCPLWKELFINWREDNFYKFRIQPFKFFSATWINLQNRNLKICLRAGKPEEFLLLSFWINNLKDNFNFQWLTNKVPEKLIWKSCRC